MLFRNLRSGGIVSATNEDSIALMQRSPIYEEYIPPTPEKKRKSGKPPKQDAPDAGQTSDAPDAGQDPNTPDAGGAADAGQDD